MSYLKEYHKYLTTRKTISFIYKILFIYPFFLKYLGEKNIDYGCGIGDFQRFCRFFKNKIKGVDINKYNIEYCKKLNLDACCIPKNSIIPENRIHNELDFVILDNVIEHMQHPNNLLNDLAKKIKQNGYLVIGVPVGRKGYESDPDHKIFYSEVTLDKLITKYSFSKIDFFYRPFKSDILKNISKIYCYYSIYKKN